MPALAVVAAALPLLLASCGAAGSGHASGTSARRSAAAGPGRPVDDAQALVLAQLLERDFRAHGVRFRGRIPIQAAAVEFDGAVDFHSGRGTAVVRAPGAPAARGRRYVWTRHLVLAQASPGSVRFLAQRPEPKQDPVHSAIAFVELLAAETIDNTANIEQQDARFVRRTTLGGSPVDLYVVGAREQTSYWVDHRDGMLRRVKASLGGRGTIDLTLTAHAPVGVTLPPRAHWSAAR